MFEVTIEREFCAAHAIRIAGAVEPVHGHNWRVTATLAGPALDDDLLLCDFHALEARLDAILAPFVNRNLNETPPFDRTNPTAEAVARHVGDALARDLPPPGAPRLRVAAVTVTEAPGCRATYRPETAP